MAFCTTQNGNVRKFGVHLARTSFTREARAMDFAISRTATFDTCKTYSAALSRQSSLG